MQTSLQSWERASAGDTCLSCSKAGVPSKLTDKQQQLCIIIRRPRIASKGQNQVTVIAAGKAVQK